MPYTTGGFEKTNCTICCKLRAFTSLNHFARSLRADDASRLNVNDYINKLTCTYSHDI